MKKSNEIKPGLKFRGFDRDPWYVVTLFEDKGEEFVVIKSWAKYKQYWVYKVEAKESLQEWLEIQTREAVEKDPTNG
jgi:hypothetical protein